MVKILKNKLNNLFLMSKLVDKKDFTQAIEVQQKKGGQLSQILVDQSKVTEEDLMIYLCQKLDIPPVDIAKCKIDPEIVRLIPEQVARHCQIIPVSKIGPVITIAMSDPLNVFAMDDVRTLTGFDIQPVISTSSGIIKAIDENYGPTPGEAATRLAEGEDGVVSIKTKLVPEEGDLDIRKIAKFSQEAPIVKMVSLILIEALKARASDIHIEPYEKELRVRYRVDGMLYKSLILPKRVEHAILARLKIMSELEITQRRLPQDGRFTVKFENREIDFRVSILPTNFGEKAVLRILDKSNLQLTLDKLGFSASALQAFKASIVKPFGVILLTGPTGSGKSTTLYSMLNRLNTLERNITTIEDPVEYRVKGVTQVQTKSEIGLTFANTLRSVLRQSPDVIMVGEIRDLETVDIAIKASLTGHLVLSTLHTNDAPEAINRLVDMGVEPFLISSSLIMVAAQRLCRKICPHCKHPYEAPTALLDRLKIDFEKEKPAFYCGSGCARCNHTGYFGRVAVVEALVIDDRIREMVLERSSINQIKEYARSQGMKTLKDDALQKAFDGEISLAEVFRVTPEG